MTHKNAKPQMSNYSDCAISDTFWQNFPLSQCFIFHSTVSSSGENKLNTPEVSYFFPTKALEDLKPVKSKPKFFKTGKILLRWVACGTKGLHCFKYYCKVFRVMISNG